MSNDRSLTLDNRHILALSEWAKRLDRDDLPIGPDDWVSHCHSLSDPPELSALLHTLTSQASELIGKPLSPVNSFLRRYEHGAALKRHVDRPEIDWTVSLTLYHDGPPWPLHIETGPLYGPTILLHSGAVEHWREPFSGTVSIIGLLHWGVEKRQPGPHFCHIPHLLSQEQITALSQQLTGHTFVSGQLSHKGIKVDGRVSQIAWLYRTKGWQWLYDILFSVVHVLNQQYWHREITAHSGDDLQFSRYAAGSHYDWHTDYDAINGGQITKRQISLVCLVKPATAGGGLELRNGGVIQMQPGDAVVFPSEEEHRALEVASGVRESVVLWASHG